MAVASFKRRKFYLAPEIKSNLQLISYKFYMFTCFKLKKYVNVSKFIVAISSILTMLLLLASFFRGNHKKKIVPKNPLILLYIKY